MTDITICAQSATINTKICTIVRTYVVQFWINVFSQWLLLQVVFHILFEFLLSVDTERNSFVQFLDNEPSYVHHTDFILEAVSLMGPDPLGAGYVPVVTRSEEEFSSGME